MIYDDYDSGVMYQDDLYRAPPALSQGRQGGHQHPDHQQYHEGPPSGNPFDDPFFNNFLKGVLIVCVNERVNHRNLIQANNSKKCHSHNNNNSRSRFPNSRQPLPRSSPVHPLFTSLRHHNDNSNNISNHNNKDLSRNRSRRLYKNRRIASSKQVLGNPLQKDRDNLNGSESLP